ncbi:MAG: tetratricopeptide repeat protein, partial [Candidatus Acidiferrum sp.]
NWGRVLRHEIVHIFNLEQTHFLVPHWLTEGLAVGNEGFPRPQTWSQLLRERVASGELMNLDSIELGFIRPRNPLEWQMAYCQSQLYVEYIKEISGPAAIGSLLDAFRDGLTSASAIRKVCKIDKVEFEAGYRAFLEDTVKALPGKPTPKKRTLSELKAAHDKDPSDPDAGANLAEALIGRDRAVARQLAESALEKKKGHPVASLVLARLEKQAGNVKQERALLEAAVNKETPDSQVLQALAKIYYDASEFPKAAELLEIGRAAEPGAAQWLQALARVYAQTGEKDKQIAVLKELVPTDADDFDSRKKLADLLAKDSQWADAEKYARGALEIDVESKDIRDILDRSLREQKRAAEADRIKALLAGPGQ